MREYLEARGVSGRILVAVLAVAGAVLLRLALSSLLGPRTPFVTFYPAVMLAALFGGLVAGLGTYSARLSAEAQGGSINLTTAEALGTTVTVRLPLTLAAA